VAPIDSADWQVRGYAAGLQTANAAAINGFTSAGSAPTAAQLTPVVTAYRAALNVYGFQLHFIQWPASMQSAVAADQHSWLRHELVAVVLHGQTSRHGRWLSDVRDLAARLRPRTTSSQRPRYHFFILSVVLLGGRAALSPEELSQE